MKKRITIIVLLLFVITSIFMPVTVSIAETATDSKEQLQEETNEPVGLDWRLILVNTNHPLPDDYQVELLDLSNGCQVDVRIYADLQKMFDDCRAQGMELFVRDGYRAHEEQKKLYDEKIESFLEEGYSRQEAEEIARTWVAVPGTSEHETGLAVDINPDMNISTTDEVYTWLENNSYRYGFIKRYPSEKADITGINDEPWHFRYVGYEAAEEIYHEGLCLEEYLKKNYHTE